MRQGASAAPAGAARSSRPVPTRLPPGSRSSCGLGAARAQLNMPVECYVVRRATGGFLPYCSVVL